MAKLKTKKIPLTRQPQDRWYEVDTANKTDVVIRSAKFIGYKSFYAIEPPDSEDQEEPDVQAQIPVNPATKEESAT